MNNWGETKGEIYGSRIGRHLRVGYHGGEHGINLISFWTPEFPVLLSLESPAGIAGGAGTIWRGCVFGSREGWSLSFEAGGCCDTVREGDCGVGVELGVYWAWYLLLLGS